MYNYIEHRQFAEERPNHKYIYRKWKNGRWYYYYETKRGDRAGSNTSGYELQKEVNRLNQEAAIKQKTERKKRAKDKVSKAISRIGSSRMGG